MELQTQKDEFEVRLYRWALAQTRREVQAGFPILRNIKSSEALKTLEIVQSLSQEEQLHLALTLTRNAHPRVLQMVGEPWTAQEEELRLSFMKKRMTFSTYSFDLNQRLANGTDIKVNKQRFKTLLQDELKPIFGDVFRDDRFEWQYRIQIGFWHLDTTIKVDNRDRFQLVYSHSIIDAEREDEILSHDISMLNCIGMVPPSWDLLADADAPMAAKSFALLCSHLMGALPELLDGLSPPPISPQDISIAQAKQEAKLLKDEFYTRFYRWCLADARREVEEDFPFVRRINNFDALETLAAMEPLSKEEQIRVALTLVRYAGRRQLRADEYLTEEEEELWESFIKGRQRMYLMPLNSRIAEMYQQIYGAKTCLKFNKRKFRSLVKQELKPLLGKVFQSEGSDWGYRVQIGDWYVKTLVENDPGLSYSHAISTAKHKPLGSIVVSGAGIDVLRWLGMGSTNWNLITEEDLPMAAKSLAIVCSHFLQAVPELLADLSPL